MKLATNDYSFELALRTKMSKYYDDRYLNSLHFDAMEMVKEIENIQGYLDDTMRSIIIESYDQYPYSDYVQRISYILGSYYSTILDKVDTFEFDNIEDKLQTRYLAFMLEFNSIIPNLDIESVYDGINRYTLNHNIKYFN